MTSRMKLKSHMRCVHHSPLAICIRTEAKYEEVQVVETVMMMDSTTTVDDKCNQGLLTWGPLHYRAKSALFPRDTVKHSVILTWDLLPGLLLKCEMIDVIPRSEYLLSCKETSGPLSSCTRRNIYIVTLVVMTQPAMRMYRCIILIVQMRQQPQITLYCWSMIATTNEQTGQDCLCRPVDGAARSSRLHMHVHVATAIRNIPTIAAKMAPNTAPAPAMTLIK